jgi:Mce-associated membrane protein
MSSDVDTEAAPTEQHAGDPEAGPPDEAAAPAEPSPAERGGADSSRRRLALLLAAVAVAAALVTALIVTYVRLVQSNAVSDARSTALAAAKGFATELSSYDYQHLDQDFGSVVKHSADPFKSQFSRASKDLAPLIRKYQASSAGIVVGAGVSDATTDRATVVVFVDQTVRNTNSPTPRVDRNRLRLTLTHGGGGWLIDRVEVL